MTKLWYEIKKKLGNLHIDKNCKLCQGSLENLELHGLKKGYAVIIIPDFNAFGVCWKAHIGITPQESIKETKIYKDLMEE